MPCYFIRLLHAEVAPSCLEVQMIPSTADHLRNTPVIAYGILISHVVKII